MMKLRWIAGALSDAKGRLRRLRGHRYMKPLMAALQAHCERIDKLELKAAEDRE